VCPACRLFGSQFGKQEQQKAGAYQSKVFFSDAKMEGNLNPSVGEINIHTHLPHPSPSGGRVIYKHFSPSIHLSSKSPGGRGRNENYATIAYVPRGSQFAFTVDFSNLANDALNDEFSLLLYSLVLEESMAHKVGFGKAKGLGSVQIQITRLQASQQPREVYSSLTTPRFTYDLSSLEDIAPFVQARRETFLSRLDQSQVQRLRMALTLPDDLLSPDA
jgi:CRISPR/Cas system CSM-associated protein Csm3 (group 7 of RAMP superfamily)